MTLRTTQCVVGSQLSITPPSPQATTEGGSRLTTYLKTPTTLVRYDSSPVDLHLNGFEGRLEALG